jgi:hypothetical protein
MEDESVQLQVMVKNKNKSQLFQHFHRKIKKIKPMQVRGRVREREKEEKRLGGREAHTVRQTELHKYQIRTILSCKTIQNEYISSRNSSSSQLSMTVLEQNFTTLMCILNHLGILPKMQTLIWWVWCGTCNSVFCQDPKV